MDLRIVLEDGYSIAREILHGLIEREPGMEVIAQADDARTAVALVRKHAPDVAIMDIDTSHLSGIEAMRQIRARDAGIKFIVLSMYDDQRFIDAVLGAGASGYLLKNCAGEELVPAIRAVTAGRIYLSPTVSERMERRSVSKNGGYSTEETRTPDFHLGGLFHEG